MAVDTRACPPKLPQRMSATAETAAPLAAKSMSLCLVRRLLEASPRALDTTVNIEIDLSK